MNEDKPWATPLGVDPSKYQLWASQTPENQSMTVWCLETNKIPVIDYLMWAREHYGIAVVKDPYFKMPFSQELWLKIKDVANWSPDLLPLEEWDGVVFIGCVEPPLDIRWSFPVRYVLASPKNLKHRWESLNASPHVDSPMGLDFSLGDASANITPPSPRPSSEDLSDPFARLSANLDANMQSSQSPQLNLPDSSPPSTQTNTNVSNGSFHSFDDLQDIPEPTQNSVVTTPTMPQGLNFDQMGPVNLKDTPESPLSDSFSKPISSAPCAPAPEGSVIDTRKIAPNDLNEATTDSQAVAWAFHRLRSHFHHSMILLFSGDELVPWKWEKPWVPRSSENFKPFSLEQPSLFRIVYRTRLPYHGHVVPSEANVQFFLNWGHESLPAHVTTLPIIIEGHLLGILLSVGETSTNTPEVLDFCERIALPLGQKLVSLKRKSAA